MKQASMKPTGTITIAGWRKLALFVAMCAAYDRVHTLHS